MKKLLLLFLLAGCAIHEQEHLTDCEYSGSRIDGFTSIKIYIYDCDGVPEESLTRYK